MKVLTVRQPWAWAIIHGGKGIENRTRAFSHRGPVAIHAGLAIDPDGFNDPAAIAAGGRSALMRYGVVIGVVNVVDAHKAVALDRLDGSVGCCCEPWGQPGRVHHVLENPIPLPEPVELRGRLGLLDIDDPWAEADIERQLLRLREAS